MKRFWFLCLLFPLLAATRAGDGLVVNPPSPFDGVEGKWAHAMLDQLSLDEKIGQLIMVAAYSNKDDAHYNQIDYLVRKMNIGGLIFMQGGPGRQAELVNRYQSQARIPLLIAQDSEWGLSMRLDSTVRFPRNMTLGAIRNDSLIYELGCEIARECKLVGVQMNFAPDVDVNNNPANPVINDRSFGEIPDEVARKGVAFYQGMKSEGVLACAKHFPGHGDTDTDSHLDLPIVPHNRQRLDSVELVPFRRMIDAGVQSVMIAHLYVPNIDSTPNRATTLSPKVVTGLLRDELGYNGLIITDALNMQGVAKYYQPGEVDLAAFQAGNDILLFSGNVNKAVELIRKAVEEGKIPESEVDRRVLKILMAKEWAGLNKTKGMVKPIRNATDIQNGIHPGLKRRLYEAAITVATNKGNIIPLSGLDKQTLAAVQIGGKSGSEFQETLIRYAGMKTFSLPAQNDKTQRTAVLGKIGNATTVIVSVHDMNKYAGKDYGVSAGTREWIRELRSAGKKVVLVLFGNPYGGKFFGDEDAVVFAYEDEAESQVAAAEALFGGIAFSGKLPVTANAKLRAGMGEIWTAASAPAWAKPEEAGMDSRILNRIDTIAQEAIRNGATPGCAVLVMRGNKIVFDRGYGNTEYNAGVKVDPYSTVYDLASVTKISSTTLAVMRLVGEGKLNVDESIAAYLPEFRETGKAQITVKNLLLHQTGLQSWIPFHLETIQRNSPTGFDTTVIQREPNEKFCVPVMKDLWMCSDYQDSMWLKIVNSRMGPSTKVVYSDLNMIIMARIIEKITGTTLDHYVDSVFYKPMGLDHTFFNPSKCGMDKVCAPTQIDNEWRKGKVQGYVHDQTSAMLGGVSGHAGLFSNVYDLAKLFCMVKNGGTYNGRRYLEKSVIDKFTQHQVAGNKRGLGFDMQDPSSPGGGAISAKASDQTYGHLGFTGICVWVDPKADLVYIFLSNRTFPSMTNAKLVTGGYRGRVMDAIYESMR